MVAGITLLWASTAFAVTTVPKGKAGAKKPAPVAAPVKMPMVWRSDLDAALTVAGAQYRPVLVVFSSPDCPWCTKLKSGPLRDREVLALLENFVLVEIDVTKDERTPAVYQVRGVPALLIMSAEGAVRAGANGYVGATDLKKALRDALNPRFLKQGDVTYAKLLELLDEMKVTADKWPAILASLESKDKRAELDERILAYSPFPKKEFVKFLSHERLAVRLGALEILEELAGDTFGYDPWFDEATMEANEKALVKWKDWSEEEAKKTESVYSAITQEELHSYIQDLVSDNRERSRRAMRMIEHGGPKLAETLSAFLEKNPTLPEGAKKKIKEAQYALLIPAISGIEPAAIAHRLIFGNQDVRLDSLRGLQSTGSRAVPVLREFLQDGDSIVRETAADTLITAGGRHAVSILETHLNDEDDVEVVYTILRGLGRTKSKKGLAILVSYLANANENLVIAAIQSIAKLKSKTVSKELTKCLEDFRWRVRVAALDAVKKLKMKSLGDKVA